MLEKSTIRELSKGFGVETNYKLQDQLDLNATLLCFEGLLRPRP